eukprot:TRINITY_DN7128_c0_g2_i2.p1 TRINITY_DN7128_c0_g2~~TRINITY_DN7128_c0_g2_i2.p1  ORF type:complete len:484 (-),score=129.44 TRINITY_DN7128_c0_g2_i2:44-1495(-)
MYTSSVTSSPVAIGHATRGSDNGGSYSHHSTAGIMSSPAMVGAANTSFSQTPYYSPSSSPYSTPTPSRHNNSSNLLSNSGHSNTNLNSSLSSNPNNISTSSNPNTSTSSEAMFSTPIKTHGSNPIPFESESGYGTPATQNNGQNNNNNNNIMEEEYDPISRAYKIDCVKYITSVYNIKNLDYELLVYAIHYYVGAQRRETEKVYNQIMSGTMGGSFERFRVLERFYSVIFELSLPWPRTFMVEFTMLGFLYLEKTSFYSYLERGVFTLFPNTVTEILKILELNKNINNNSNNSNNNSNNMNNSKDNLNNINLNSNGINITYTNANTLEMDFKFGVISKLNRKHFIAQLEKYKENEMYLLEHFYSLMKKRNNNNNGVFLAEATETTPGGNPGIRSPPIRAEINDGDGTPTALHHAGGGWRGRIVQQLQKTDESWFIPGTIFIMDFEEQYPDELGMTRSSQYKARYITSRYMACLARELGVDNSV